MVKKAVLIGCNYPGTKAELHGCINDVWRIHKSLVERFGFQEEDISILIDTDPKYPSPTGANIKAAIRTLITQASPGDVLFVHYSGHGTRLPAETGEDDDTGYDECIVPCDMNLLSDEDFREFVEMVPEGVIYTMISDSCHSGGLIEAEKEQIGDSYINQDDDDDDKDKAEGGGGGGGFRAFLSDALETRGINLPFGHSHHKRDLDDEHFQSVQYGGGMEGVKSRDLPISTFVEMLKQQTGKEDIDVGNIRPTLFDTYGQDSSSKVKTFVKILVQSIQGENGEGGGGGLFGMIGSLAKQFMKQKLDNSDDSYEYTKPALETHVSDPKLAFAGAKVGYGEGGVPRVAVLLSGCQSDETSADANPSGNPNEAFGAMSNAIQTVLANHDGPITNRQLVIQVRKILAKQGYTQHPGLYCSDDRADDPFIC